MRVCFTADILLHPCMPPPCCSQSVLLCSTPPAGEICLTHQTLSACAYEGANGFPCYICCSWPYYYGFLSSQVVNTLLSPKPVCLHYIRLSFFATVISIIWPVSEASKASLYSHYSLWDSAIFRALSFITFIGKSLSLLDHLGNCIVCLST